MVGATLLTACHEDESIKAPGDCSSLDMTGRPIQHWAANPNDPADTTGTGFVIPKNAISVDEALDLCSRASELGWSKATVSGTTKYTSTQTYLIHGIIYGNDSKRTSTATGAYFLMTSGETSTRNNFEAYNVKGPGNTTFTNVEKQTKRGNYVIVEAKLCLFGSTPETDGGYVKDILYKHIEIQTEGDGTQEKPYTIADLVKLEDQISDKNLWFTGTIVGAINTSNELEKQNVTVITNFAVSTDVESATETTSVEVKLPNGAPGSPKKLNREALAPYNHAENIGKQVLVHGTITYERNKPMVVELFDEVIFENMSYTQNAAPEPVQ